MCCETNYNLKDGQQHGPQADTNYMTTRMFYSKRLAFPSPPYLRLRMLVRTSLGLGAGLFRCCRRTVLCSQVWTSSGHFKTASKFSTNTLPPPPISPSCTANYVYQIWQREWDETVLVCNKFHEILLKLPDKVLFFCNTKKEDTVLNRFRIGHSYLTHYFEKRRGSCLCCM